MVSCMNPHAGNAGDILKHLVLALAVDAAAKRSGGLAIYAETHGGLPHNNLAADGYRYPTALLKQYASTTPQGQVRPLQPMPYAHEYCNTRRAGRDGGYKKLLRINLPDPFHPKQLRTRTGLHQSGGTWYPGSVGLVAELTASSPLSHLLVRDTNPAAMTELPPLFPQTNIITAISGGLDADSPFGAALRRALAYRRPTDGTAVVLIDPFNLAKKEGADATESRRLLWELAAHPARAVVLAWYPIHFVRGQQQPPTPPAINGLWAAFSAGPYPLSGGRLELRWFKNNQGRRGAGLILLNPPTRGVLNHAVARLTYFATAWKRGTISITRVDLPTR